TRRRPRRARHEYQLLRSYDRPTPEADGDSRSQDRFLRTRLLDALSRPSDVSSLPGLAVVGRRLTAGDAESISASRVLPGIRGCGPDRVDRGSRGSADRVREVGPAAEEISRHGEGVTERRCSGLCLSPRCFLMTGPFAFLP